MFISGFKKAVVLLRVLAFLALFFLCNCRLGSKFHSIFSTLDCRHCRISVLVQHPSDYVFQFRCLRHGTTPQVGRHHGRRSGHLVGGRPPRCRLAPRCSAATAAPSSTACRSPASAHDRSYLWQPLAPLCLGRCDGEPRCNFAAESASVFAAAPFAQLCSTLLGLGMGFPLEPRLADVLRAEAPQSELAWKLYRLLWPRNVRAEA